MIHHGLAAIFDVSTCEGRDMQAGRTQQLHLKPLLPPAFSSNLKPFNICISVAALCAYWSVRLSIDLMKPFTCFPSKTSDSVTELQLASSSYSLWLLLIFKAILGPRLVWTLSQYTKYLNIHLHCFGFKFISHKMESVECYLPGMNLYAWAAGCIP